jgi:hypothetical protein
VTNTNYVSENVGLDGNYSIQVIGEALKQTNDMWLESADSEANRGKDHSQAESAMICNSQAHWVAMRKVKGTWYNLNSCHPDGPQIITAFDFDPFLANVT